jgi:hypothetical protein
MEGRGMSRAKNKKLREIKAMVTARKTGSFRLGYAKTKEFNDLNPYKRAYGSFESNMR